MRRIKGNTTLVGVSELRTQADEILKVAQQEPVIVEKRHKPMAVLVPIAEYERTESLLDELEDAILGFMAKERMEKYGHMKMLTLEDLEQLVKGRRKKR